jgi:hypothetical protein
VEAYFIDAANKTVTRIEYDGNWRNISKTIGCDRFTVVNVNEHGDGIFLDDEGHYEDDQNYFWFDGYPTMLAGNGLVLGTDKDGDSIEPCQSIEWFNERIRFQNKDTAPLFVPDLTPKVYTFDAKD